MPSLNLGVIRGVPAGCEGGLQGHTRHQTGLAHAIVRATFQDSKGPTAVRRKVHPGFPGSHGGRYDEASRKSR